MAPLPPSLVRYKRTPSFTEVTVPAGLLNDHSTKNGTWGLIHVEEGRLRYMVTDARRERGDFILTPDSAPGVIEPMILHRVEPLGWVQFHVEFWKAVALIDRPPPTD